MKGAGRLASCQRLLGLSVGNRSTLYVQYGETYSLDQWFSNFLAFGPRQQLKKLVIQGITGLRMHCLKISYYQYKQTL